MSASQNTENNNFSRREFISTTLKLAGGLVANGVLPGEAMTHEGTIPDKYAPANRSNPSTLISLPKSGGAVAGLGETFEPNLMTGTENISIPLPLSPGRDGFGPKLGLRYSVDNGNGPFGLGWKLTLPQIQRKTQTRLPQYNDEDQFLFIGSGDIVPRLAQSPFMRFGYQITQYRLRFEGSFSRIERWDRVNPNPDNNFPSSLWLVTDKENITSVFGVTPTTKLAKPNTDKILMWALELTIDGKGNFVHYQYKPEDAEKQIYLKRICYGNLRPRLFNDPTEILHFLPAEAKQEICFFETVFDYGEHSEIVDGDEVVTRNVYHGTQPWDSRPDTFSDFRAGFEISTERRCKRVLMFHRVPGEKWPLLVGSTDFAYKTLEHNQVSTLNRVIRRGYMISESRDHKYSEDFIAQKGQGVRSSDFEIASLPPLDFDYSEFDLPNAETDVKTLSLWKGIGEEPDRGIDDDHYTLVDLFGRGLPDILKTSNQGYFYWKNQGFGEFASKQKLDKAPRRGVSGQGSYVTLADEGVGFGEISGDGSPDILVIDSRRQFKFCEQTWNVTSATKGAGWINPREFDNRDLPKGFKFDDRTFRLLDLTGNGTLDALKIESYGFVVYECKGVGGYQKSWTIPTESLPPGLAGLDFNDTGVHLADMTGDGLLDIVHIDGPAGNVHYWPNLGYGHFGNRVTMRNSLGRRFYRSEMENMFFIDIDGSGPVDLVYVDRKKIDVWINCSGKEWQEKVIEGTPTRYYPVTQVDLFGENINGILWSGSGGFREYKYLPLSKTKPGLLKEIDNNMGKRIRYDYISSAELALQSQNESWVGRLPFPVYVLRRVERHDDIAGSKLVSEFTYAHGHYDDGEKEFVGFGRVEQTDTEFFDRTTLHKSGKDNIGGDLHQPPVQTVSWFHTGVHVGDDVISRHLAYEYFPCRSRTYKSPTDISQQCEAQQHSLRDSVLSSDIAEPQLKRDALRALKGRLLRKEIYALDNSDKVANPYEAVEQSYHIRLLQRATENSPAALHAYQNQALDCYYERNASDPRVKHQFTLEVDEFGNAIESATAAYQKRTPSEHREQNELLVTYSTRCFSQNTTVSRGYRHSVLAEEKTYEITGLRTSPNSFIDANSLKNQCRSAQEINYEGNPQAGILTKRLIGRTRHYFWDDDAKTPLLLCKTGLLALPRNTYTMVLTPGLIQKIYGTSINNKVLSTEGGYILENGVWWVPTGDPQKGNKQFNPQQFYLTASLTDPFGAVTDIAYDEYELLITKVSDPLGNVTTATVDYRTMLPSQIQDPNGNRTMVAFDALGLVVGLAVMGKNGKNNGDSLSDFVAHLDREKIRRHIEQPLANAPTILANATTRIVYDLWSFCESERKFRKTDSLLNSIHSIPGVIAPVIHTFTRETHASDLRGGNKTKIQHSFVYFDGFGREVQTKVHAAPGKAPVRDRQGELKRNSDGSLVIEPIDDRWVGTGRTVYDNKGNVIKKYEPFFCSTFQLETESDLVDWGMTPVLRYDPLGRLVRTDYPDGSMARTVFDAWTEKVWDRNDTVLDRESTWLEKYMNSGEEAKRRAAELTRKHANTHSLDYLDVLGRKFLHIDDNGELGKYSTHQKLDIQGNVIQITDARKNPALISDYDMRGRVVRTQSIDSGKRVVLESATGTVIRSWDSVGNKIRRLYDKLQRLTHVFTQRGAEKERLAEFRVYGEEVPNAEKANLRGQLFREYGGAGLTENAEYDFKGNLIRTKQTFSRNVNLSDWSNVRLGNTGNLLDSSKSFETVYHYDALNRPFREICPDKSMMERVYDQGGLVKMIHIQLNGSGPVTAHVENIEYNAKKQIVNIAYGNKVVTSQTYDPLTFRLEYIHSTRPGTKPLLQDLQYTYDAVGNIIEVQDKAQQPAFVSNERVEAKWQYEYDALYRLKRVQGREHQSLSNSRARDHQDIPFITAAHPNDVQAMRNYTEEYKYDAVGNLLSVQHRANQGSWTQQYQYHDSSNRLKSTMIPGGVTGTTYKHDANGNMTRLPHLSNMSWDYDNRLVGISKGNANNGKAIYAYDVTGKRTRSVVARGGIVDERLYIGNYEVFRRQRAGSTNLERTTLHIMLDDGSRIATIERISIEDARQLQPPKLLIRYQLKSNLGSIHLEANQEGRVITYEEFHPFGTTSYRAKASGIEVNEARFRYAGKEKDDETGFYYFGARYYAPWLSRWMSCDPAGMVDGANLYSYSRNNPTTRSDFDGKESYDRNGAGAASRDVYKGAGAFSDKVDESTSGGGGVAMMFNDSANNMCAEPSAEAVSENQSGTTAGALSAGAVPENQSGTTAGAQSAANLATQPPNSPTAESGASASTHSNSAPMTQSDIGEMMPSISNGVSTSEMETSAGPQSTTPHQANTQSTSPTTSPEAQPSSDVQSSTTKQSKVTQTSSDVLIALGERAYTWGKALYDAKKNGLPNLSSGSALTIDLLGGTLALGGAASKDERLKENFHAGENTFTIASGLLGAIGEGITLGGLVGAAGVGIASYELTKYAIERWAPSVYSIGPRIYDHYHRNPEQ